MSGKNGTIAKYTPKVVALSKSSLVFCPKRTETKLKERKPLLSSARCSLLSLLTSKNLNKS